MEELSIHKFTVKEVWFQYDEWKSARLYLLFVVHTYIE